MCKLERIDKTESLKSKKEEYFELSDKKLKDLFK